MSLLLVDPSNHWPPLLLVVIS